MFPMMTPIDAISLSLRAGMMFGQTQTLWVSRMMEMQGFWAGYPRLAVTGVSAPVVEAEPEVDAEDAAPVVLAPLTEIHVAETVTLEPAPLPVVEAEASVTVDEALPEAMAEGVASPVLEVAAPEPVAEVALPEPVLAPVVEAAPATPVAETPPPVTVSFGAAPAPKTAPNPKRAKKPAPRAE